MKVIEPYDRVRPTHLGKHLLVDLEGCNPELIARIEWVSESMIRAAFKARCSVVGKVFHQFEPHGVTGVVLLSESHIAVHTWPEFGSATLDFFTCGESDYLFDAVELLREAFGAQGVFVQLKTRGKQVQLAQLKSAPEVEWSESSQDASL